MKILVVGSGGREHAICAAFARSPRVSKLYCADGNAGIAVFAQCVDIKPDAVTELADFAAANAVGITFVGCETPLALGIVDEFERRGLAIIGPNRAAAQLESSKAFAKNFMGRRGIPTAGYHVANSPDAARFALINGELGDRSTPVVVKADGLAAGKGVVVAKNLDEALSGLDEIVASARSEAASQIVLEECLIGSEVSLILFADGEDFALMPPARDHKRIGEGDTGPNTGGMGTFTDDSLLSEEQKQEIVDTIVRPTLKGCKDEGFPFRGILFLGLMMTDAGPKVIEYNVRFGDPETQSILVRLETDLLDICEAMLSGDLSGLPIEWMPGSSACVILASKGYPGKSRTGDVIDGLEAAAEMPGVILFHAATAENDDGRFVTAGGRVLGVTTTGRDLSESLDRAYAAVATIRWAGMQYRRDIGKTQQSS